MRNSVWADYRMTNSSSFKRRNDRHDRQFNPFLQTCKILDFAEQAAQKGVEKFAVIAEDGNLTWTTLRKGKKHPGFIIAIDRSKLAIGFSEKAWRIVEEKIAAELTKQRKD